MDRAENETSRDAGTHLRVYPLRVLICIAIGLTLVAPLEQPWFLFARNVLLVAYPVIELVLLARVFGTRRRAV